MQRSKRWSFDQLADAAEQQQRHSDAEQDHRPASRIFFRPPDGIPLLKPGPVRRRYPWKNVVFLQSRKRF